MAVRNEDDRIKQCVELEFSLWVERMNRILRNFSNEDKRGHERKEGRKNVEKRWKQTKKRRMKVFTLFKLVKHKAFKRSCKVVLTDYSNLNLETSTECFVWSVVEKTGRMRDKNLCFGEERRWYVEERVEVTMDWTPQPHPQRTQTHTKNGKSWLRPEQANRQTKTLFTSAASILIIRLKIDCSTYARVTLISLYVLLTAGALASIITSIVQDSSCITTTRPACTTNVKNDDQLISKSSITRFFSGFSLVFLRFLFNSCKTLQTGIIFTFPVQKVISQRNYRLFTV